MYVRTVFALALLALAGCQPAAPPLATAPPPRGVEVFATLAPLGSFEWRAAPTYTRNAVLRHRAAVLLNDQRITVAEATRIQASADGVRRLLDQAVRLDAGQDSAAALAVLAKAVADLAAAEHSLEGR